MKKFAPFFISLLLVTLPIVVIAQTSNTGGGSPSSNTGGGSPTGNSLSTFQLTNPLDVSSFCGLVQKLLNAGLQLGVPVALLFLVYSGFLFVVARGNPTKLQHAKANFAYVLLGIAIYFGAWLLGQIVANTINAISPNTINGCQ